MRNLGEAEDAVRVKSAELDEIAGEDLLSEYSQVRWIITKAALMEGWDCSFRLAAGDARQHAESAGR